MTSRSESESYWYGEFIKASGERDKLQGLLRQLREERDKAVVEWRLARSQAEDLALKLKELRKEE